MGWLHSFEFIGRMRLKTKAVTQNSRCRVTVPDGQRALAELLRVQRWTRTVLITFFTSKTILPKSAVEVCFVV
jgi:hypothetical protein